ncbi:DUF3592 domain-containing protein [Kribbella shirazensis]|uniref:DUF3592 domain-containing protein n=1 Tax=Kribbella shirazensis TaxID=1105143 RepID=A0A7X5V9G2_9ACTN|nr:DUF3592 domain-containing protein [Kribbella shirazensis]NIK57084.1 hypothetical protein [Kribbella shirazensis]
MRRVRAGLGWVFVRGPAAAYALADSGSSLFGIGAVVAMALVAGVGAGIGALAGLAAQAPVGDAAFVGGMVGLGAVTAWLVLSLVVVAVLWVRGISPSQVATGKKSTGRHASASDGWRRRGQPLVPGSLVGFFLLIAVLFGALGLHARSVARPANQATAITNGTVVAVHEPGWFDRGSGSVDIRYTVAGVGHTIESTRDPGEHFLRLGDVVPIEYVVAEPAKGRSTWVVESAREDRVFWLWLAGICAGLGLLSGAGYAVGRLRSSGRRGG